MDDIIFEENVVVEFDDQVDGDSLSNHSVGDEDSDVLFEQLLQKAEVTLSSKSSTQQSQSYAPPSFRL